MGKQLYEGQKCGILANLGRNWYFPISALAFFSFYTQSTLIDVTGLFIAFLTMLIVASRTASIWEKAKNGNIILKLISVATVIAVCLCGKENFCTDSSAFQNVQNAGALSVFLAIAAFPFVYICVLIFWNYVIKTVCEAKLFDDIRISEWAVYSLILVASLAFMVFVYLKTDIFYGNRFSYDTVYTSDSSGFLKKNVYLLLRHPENDIRQPLFSVFSAPFIGIPYLVSRLIGASESVTAILINSVQIIMLFAANFMLARMLKLDSSCRICFMLLACCTYTHLLFILMLEQYIVAYFWLIFCIYLIVENGKPCYLAFFGASGTLLTSMALLPFVSDKSPLKNFKGYFFDIAKCCLGFVILVPGFFRFDVIASFYSKVSFLSGFTGRSLTLSDKFFQYTDFISGCFFAPDAGVNTAAAGHISWQLTPAASINAVGVIILLLALVGALWTFEKKSSRLALYWVGFSVIMLLVLGWGTMENGLILYALYFGWAFFALVFGLFEKLLTKLKIGFLLPVLSICLSVIMLLINIPAIIDIVNFATFHYPV